MKACRNKGETMGGNYISQTLLWTLIGLCYPYLGSAQEAPISDAVKKEIPGIVKIYQELHANPELSFQEYRTAAFLAKELRALKFEVREKIGRTGVVGVLKNGDGPKVLVRTDMDALPVLENTGLAFASKMVAKNEKGQDTGVMHACGHDVHMTAWLGIARIFSANRTNWKGTLILIAQPAEEIGLGAKAMLEDGLYKDFPKPDFALALHCDAFRPTGTIGVCEGVACANVDSVDIVVKGRGGHGASPHNAVDPIVLAARIILDLQTLVSREINPLDPAVVTVGSIQGGTKHNIIPAEVRLQITVRSMKDSVRKHLLEGIARIARTAAEGARAPAPTVLVRQEEFTPMLSNNVPLTQRLRKVWESKLGREFVSAREPVMGGEDFSRYAQGGVPVCMFFLGTVPKEKWAKQQGMSLPSLHSEFFYPAMPTTVETGVEAMRLAVLELMQP